MPRLTRSSPNSQHAQVFEVVDGVEVKLGYVCEVDTHDGHGWVEEVEPKDMRNRSTRHGNFVVRDARTGELWPEPPRLPWVGWYDVAGEAHFASWVGETRHVIVAPTPPNWAPRDGVPDGAKVYETPTSPAAVRRYARELGGTEVIVFTSMPAGVAYVEP